MTECFKCKSKNLSQSYCGTGFKTEGCKEDRLHSHYTCQDCGAVYKILDKTKLTT